MSNTAQSVLDVARGEIGYSRWSDPQAGTKYGRWYAGQTGEPYYGQSGVPYCAMFATWVFARAGATCPGLPSAYCPYIVRDGKKAGRSIPKRDAKPGDVVLFDWGGDGVSDHVGIVESNNGSYLTTIEGNTSSGNGGSQGNGGGVYRRTRSFSVVCCVLRPTYSTDETSTTSTAVEKIEEDGWWGPATTRRLQRFFGTPEDGIVSSQWSGDAWRHKGCTSFEHDPSGVGSTLVRAIQVKLTSFGYRVAIDDLCGPSTINAMIDHFARESGATERDGKLDGPSITIRAMQHALNEGRF